MAGSRGLVRHAVAMVMVALLTWSPVTSNDPTNCGGQADIALILDSSASIGAKDYSLQLNFAADLVADFIVGPKDIQFSAIIFSSIVLNAFGFTTYKTSEEVQEAIRNLTYLAGGTRTGRALNLARTVTFTPENGARPHIPYVAIAMTDGLSFDTADTATEAYLLKKSGVIVIAIGVGNNVDYYELKAIASPNLVFNVSDYSVLGAIRSQIKKNVCQELNNTRTNESCIHDNGCVGKPDGNYQSCKSECERGFYYTCSHEYSYRKICDLGYYNYPNGTTFTARKVYVQESDTCELEASYCPRTPQNFSEVPPSSNNSSNQPYESKSCLSSNDSCAGKQNGDYPRCDPECKDGYFITCSNSERYVMPCALGFYRDSNNKQYTARMVFDAATGECLLKSSSCPREDPVPQLPPSGPDSNPDGPGVTPQCSGKADVLLILDSSASIQLPNYEVMKTFVAGLTKQFTVGSDNVQFSVIIYSSSAILLFKFSDYKNGDDISTALLNAPYLNALTDTAAALRLGREVAFSKSSGARDNVGRVCVLYTDGLSNDPSATAAEAALMKQLGILVIAVGIGPGTDKTELLTIASSPKQVFEVANFTVLGAVRSALVTTACNLNQSSTCITGSCSERPNGLYTACHPECQQGYYYSCFNQEAKKMPCALGWYTYPNGTRFTARMVFVESSSTCESEAGYCPRDPQKFPVGAPTPASNNNNNNSIGYSQCLNNSCVGKPNGNYPACSPDCKQGYYYTCSNELLNKMSCPLGYYTTDDGIRFEARLVYNAGTNSCERDVASCPRDPFKNLINPTSPDTSGAQQCNGVADISIILDTSSSILETDYDLMKTFVANLTTHFNIGPQNVQFRLIIFSTNAALVFNFNRYSSKDELYQAIVAAPYLGGGTDTAAALRLVRLTLLSPDGGARQNVARVAMVYTDGLSNNPNDTAEESRLLKEIGVTVISVGVGGGVDLSELQTIASGAKLVFTVNNFTVLDAISKTLVTSACNKTLNTSSCVSNNCTGRPNGNYPACDPECKAGYFYSCSNELVYRMDCALSWYNFDNGTRFTARMVYNPISNTCERQADSCPRDPQDFVVPLPPPQPTPKDPNGNNSCLTAPEMCSGKPDGKYPMCYPECQKGFYYLCSNEVGNQMPCSDAWYTDSNQKSFTSRMVFDPATGSCQMTTASCPRQVTEKPETTTTEKPVPVCQALTDVLFMVDASQSIGRDNFGRLITFVAELTRHFNVGPAFVQVSALVFSTRAGIEFNFTAYPDNAGAYRAILRLPYYEGLTNTAEALRLARLVAFTNANAARSGANKVAIALTDGASNNANETATEAGLLKLLGVKVLAIGIGNYVVMNELNVIASSSSLVFNVSGYDVLASIVREVVITTCQTLPSTTTTTTSATTTTTTETTTLPSCVSGSCSDRPDGTYEACPPECQQGRYYVCLNGSAQQRTCDVMRHTENGNTYTVQGVYDPVAKACRSSSASCPRK